MARRRKRLQQKHPQMRHEILRDTVVGVIEKDFQLTTPCRQPASILAFYAGNLSLTSAERSVERGDVGWRYLSTSGPLSHILRQ